MSIRHGGSAKGKTAKKEKARTRLARGATTACPLTRTLSIDPLHSEGQRVPRARGSRLKTGTGSGAREPVPARA